jgi:hypothetical protein
LIYVIDDHLSPDEEIAVSDIIPVVSSMPGYDSRKAAKAKENRHRIRDLAIRSCSISVRFSKKTNPAPPSSIMSLSLIDITARFLVPTLLMIIHFPIQFEFQVTQKFK